MATEYLSANIPCTVPLNDGRTRFVHAGEVVRREDLSDFLQEKLDGDDPHYSSLFSTSSAKDYNAQDVVGYHDPAVESMLAAEAISRERVKHDVAERLGGGAPTQIPVRLDPGRTLPESGGDSPAADRFATGDNEGRDQTKQLEDLGVDVGETAQDTGKLQPDMPGETVDLNKETTRRVQKKADKEAPSTKAAGEKSDKA